MVKFGEAFRLPFSNWRRLGVLFLLANLAGAGSLVDKEIWAGLGWGLWALLLVVPVALFFSWAVTGYGLRIAGLAIHGRNELPGFEKFFSLFITGLKYVAAMIIYGLLFLLPLALAFVLIFVGASSNSAALALVGMLIAVPVGLLWLFFSMYIIPMLMAHFAHENLFSAFFELRKILKKSFTVSYFVPWIVAAAYSGALFVPLFAVIMVLASASIVFPLMNLLLIPPSALYTVIVTPTVMSLYGQAYHDVKAASPAAASAKAKGHAKSKK